MNESTELVPAEFEIDYVFTCDSDEMIEARIYPGDLLGVKACESVEHGQIAIIQTGDKYLVRRVYHGPDYICFAPTNHKYGSIVVLDGEETHVKIIGRVVKAFPLYRFLRHSLFCQLIVKLLHPVSTFLVLISSPACKEVTAKLWRKLWKRASSEIPARREISSGQRATSFLFK